jgi:RNA polymerase sigma factor (sigma-70 family)
MKQHKWLSWYDAVDAGPSPAGAQRSGTRSRAPDAVDAPADETPCTSFEEVVRRYGRFVMGKIVLRLSSDASRSLRDDIFQEVFARAGQRFQGKDGIPHPVTVFLLALVVGEVRTQVRRHTQELRRFAGELDEEAMPASRPDSEQLCQARQEEARKRQLVMDALEAMRPESAVLIRRVDIEGRSYEEVARELGCSANAVSHRLERARLQFSKIIRELTEEQR